MTVPRHTLLPLLLGATAALGLAGGRALALSPQELVGKAQEACLAGAVQAGWPREGSRLISGRALDGDRAEVVFELSRSGGTARLTCPFSASKGLLAAGAAAPTPERESPYIAAQEGSPGSTQQHPVIRQLEGTADADSERESPYAAAQEVSTDPPLDLTRLWGLVVPVLLAGGSYAVLRGREDDSNPSSEG